MGSSPRGQIRFGVGFEEDSEFPWDDGKYYGIDGWWEDVKGYKPKHQPFDSEGDYAEGWSSGDPRFAEHDAQLEEWRRNNPMPVEVDSHGTGDYPLCMLVVPGYGLTSDWDTTIISMDDLSPPPQEKIDAWVAFMDEYGIEYEGEPAWILSGYFG